jgi:hypothetical protein
MSGEREMGERPSERERGVTAQNNLRLNSSGIERKRAIVKILRFYATTG